jgi:hypothetical protein
MLRCVLPTINLPVRGSSAECGEAEGEMGGAKNRSRHEKRGLGNVDISPVWDGLGREGLGERASGGRPLHFQHVPAEATKAQGAHGMAAGCSIIEKEHAR